MKIALLTVVAAVVSVVGFWMVFTPGIPHVPFFPLMFIAVFVLPGLGGWWLIFFVIRHEKRIFPIILLAAVPYGFAYYYFERVRMGKHKSRQLA